jgi:hypothetical protein
MCASVALFSLGINCNLSIHFSDCLFILTRKAVPLHAMVALRGKEVYLQLILDLGASWG